MSKYVYRSVYDCGSRGTSALLGRDFFHPLLVFLTETARNHINLGKLFHTAALDFQRVKCAPKGTVDSEIIEPLPPVSLGCDQVSFDCLAKVKVSGIMCESCFVSVCCKSVSSADVS